MTTARTATTRRAYGLDTVATIELNGDPVAQTENCHRSYRFDINDLLTDGANELTITFMSPVRYSDQAEQRRGYYPHTEHHAFNQIRKPSYTFGWDWGIDVANAGIWREIGIDSWSGVRLAECARSSTSRRTAPASSTCTLWWSAPARAAS